jgi:hypothetical protein
VPYAGVQYEAQQIPGRDILQLVDGPAERRHIVAFNVAVARLNIEPLALQCAGRAQARSSRSSAA